jgi:hypothetical protein
MGITKIERYQHKKDFYFGFRWLNSVTWTKGDYKIYRFGYWCVGIKSGDKQNKMKNFGRKLTEKEILNGVNYSPINNFFYNTAIGKIIFGVLFVALIYAATLLIYAIGGK